MVIDQTHLKMGKLSYSSNQKNANNRRPLDEDPDVEHGFVEIFCTLIDLRERLRKMRLETEEKGCTSKYTLLMGNSIFHVTVYDTSSFFEKLFKPTVEELNLNDKRLGSKYI